MINLDSKKSLSVKIFFILISVSLLISCTPDSGSEVQARKQYEPNWRSLKRHKTPQWLSDAKFGIYCHWNPSRYPDSTIFGKNFDAEVWADLFEKAGAQFAGPVAEHWRDFPLWDSKYTKRNATTWGPKQDVVGALKQSLTKRGMKFFVSFHRPNHKQQEELGTKVREVIEKYQPDLVWFDVSLGGTLDARNWGRYVGGKNIYGKDNYLLEKIPDLPSGGVLEKIRKDFVAYYYNKGLEWGKEVEVLYKEYDLPPGVGMRDIEDGRLNELPYDEWINDMGIALPTSWWYFEGIKYKPTNWVVDEFVDMVSKNGRLLLNVGPKPDGTFHEEARKRLIEFGEWLSINKEAFFGASAWVIYGEGPTEIKELPLNHFANEKDLDFDKLDELRQAGKIITGHYSQDVEINYQPQDIRFTVKDNILYATCLGWPGKQVMIESLGSRAALLEGEIKRITMLGVEEELEWDHKPEGLVISTPNEKPCDHAFTFKIERH